MCYKVQAESLNSDKDSQPRGQRFTKSMPPKFTFPCTQKPSPFSCSTFTQPLHASLTTTASSQVPIFLDTLYL
ncbi:hypothetical protein RJT34_12710 [Clitoria ternatea]|uniref:Uncharacterized protein n=1 Tax=Clitoria ternatea TaxID=43366 RepID=A0AAN9PL60_CLITE